MTKKKVHFDFKEGMKLVLVSEEMQEDSRTETLVKKSYSRKYQICIERARIFTESYKKTEAQPPIMRNARALSKVLSELPIFIQDGELIIGNRTSKTLGAPLYPEIFTDWLVSDLDNFTRREKLPWLISDEDREIIRNVIIPYWRGRDVWSRAGARIPKNVRKLSMHIFFSIDNWSFYGIGHLIHGLKTGVNEGLLERKRKAKQYSSELNLTDPENLKKSQFYKAVSITCDAAITFSRRHAELARELAEKEEDANRQAELLRIAEICDHVPANPPRSFYEALQSTWMIFLCGCIECGGIAQSIGRLDQFLYPYYKKDIEEGIITREFARELVECLFVKLNEATLLFPDLVTQGTSNAGGLYQNVCIGGLDKDGNDVTNELSHICLESFEHLKCVSPHFSVRISDKTPHDFLLKACKAARSSSFAFFGDKLNIQGMLTKGYSLEEARVYAPVGCVEITTEGDTFSASGASFFNLTIPVIMALFNGRLPRTSKKLLTIETGDSTKFTSFDEFLDAYKKQFKYLAENIVQGLNAYDTVHAELMPTPFISANIEGCLEKGLDVIRGGAIYNYTGILGLGLANVANSLAAIKKVVFEDKTLSMEELLEILRSNYRGEKGKSVRQYIINKVPKYGNDDDYVDELAKLAVNIYYDVFQGYKNIRGGTYSLSLQSATGNVLMGMLTPPTPDGRKAKDPLADACSPSHGTERNGPTAVLKSVAKLDHHKMHNGTVVNMKVSPSMVETTEQLEKFAAMLKTYFELGGPQVQFNVLSTEQLKDAQAHPENYSDLTIRIAGYNVLFTELDKMIQDDIILRTEHLNF